MANLRLSNEHRKHKFLLVALLQFMVVEVDEAEDALLELLLVAEEALP